MARINDWGETLNQTVCRCKAEKNLQIRSLLPGEEIKIGINGFSIGSQIEEDRIITARCINPRYGVLNVICDTAKEDPWAGKYVSLGSFVFSAGGLKLLDDGLMRGLIEQRQGVAVDFSASIQAPASDFRFLLAEYQSLHLEGQQIF
jgi:hypothetical protein